MESPLKYEDKMEESIRLRRATWVRMGPKGKLGESEMSWRRSSEFGSRLLAQ